MRRIIFILMFLCVSALAFAQQSTFRINYDMALMDLPGGMIQLSDGSYVFAGTNATFIPLYGNITKTDINGNLVWSKGISSSIATQITDIIEVSPANGGGFMVCGSSEPGAILIRLTSSGVLSWARRYELPNLSGKASYEYANALKETTDGGYVVCGGVDYFWDGVSATTADTTMPFAFKVDASGNLLWSRVYVIPTTNPDEHYFTDVTETADGYVFVGATSEGTGTPNDDGDYPRDALLIKTATNGNLMYARKFGSSGSGEYLNSVLRLSTGNVLMGGFRSDNGFVLRIGGSGSTPTIDNSYGHRYSRMLGVMEFTSLTEFQDGHYGAMGFSLLFLDIGATVTKINNSTGASIFNKTFSSGLSSIIPEGGVAQDSGMYMVMTAQQMTGFNYHIVKTDKNGLMNNSNCTEGSFSPSRSNYIPGLNTYTQTVYSNMATASSFTPTITNLTPTVVVDCKNIVCIKPPAPTASASPATICQGQSSVLSASGGSNVTYHYFTDSLGNSFATGGSTTVSPTSTTTYYVAAEDNTNAGCFSYMRPVTVTVNPPATVSAGANQTICAGSTVTLAGTIGGGASSATWSGAGTFSPNANTLNAVYTPTPAQITAGTATLTLSSNDPAGPCPAASSTMTITIDALPTVYAGPDQTICAASTVTLAGSFGSTASSATWSGGTGTYNPNNTSMNAVYTPSVTEINAGSVTLTLTTNNPAGPCNAVTDNVLITINPQPTVNAGPNQAVCAGSAVTLAGSFGSSATSATWSGGTGTFSPNNTNMNAVYTPSSAEVNAGTVTLILTTNDPAGPCIASNDNMVITINPMPTANAGNNQTICQGTSANLTATGLPGSTYAWTPGSGNTASITVSPAATTVYTVFVSDANNCGTASANVTVNVVLAPVVNTNPDTICKGDTYQVMANISNYANVLWTTSGTGIFSDATILNPVYTPSNSDNNNGTVTLTVNATGNTPCGNTAGTIVLAIVEPAPPVLTNTSPPVCQNAAPFALTGSPAGGTFSGTGVSGGQFNPAVAGAGTHLITYIVSDIHGCTKGASDSLTVWPLPTADAGSNQNICAGDTVVLTATGLTGSSYEWSYNNDTTASIIVTPAITTTYTVTVTDANNCGTASDNVVLNVLPLPVIMAADDSVCTASQYQCNISATNYTSVAWASSGDGSFNSSTLLNPVYTPGNADIAAGFAILYVSATGNAPCGIVHDSLFLTILPLPAILFTDSFPGLCPNGTVLPLNTALPAGGTYTGTGVSGGVFNPQVAGTGSHLITYSYTDVYGCSNTATEPITVYTMAPVSLSAFANVCVTETAVSLSGGQPQGGTYSGVAVNGSVFNPSNAGTGVYVISYFYQDSHGCTDTAQANIIVVPEVTLSSDMPGNTIYAELGAIVNFTAVPNGQGIYTFGVDTTDMQTGVSNLFAVNTLTSDNLVYVVLNNACSDTLRIQVKPVPNAFVPFDADGINDVFMPDVELSVVNRWGQELYKGNEGWDGTYQGQNVSPGTYFYLIRLQGLNGEEKFISGTVTLLAQD